MPNPAVNQEQTFLLNLLRATNRNQEVYPLLQHNLDKLNDDFALLLRQWATCQFTSQPDKAVIIATAIVKFSKLIQRFEEGNLVNNLEIAIAGYEAALIVFTPSAFPQDRSNTQHYLVAAYQQRQQILSRTIAELKQETVQTQNKLNTLSEQLPQELQQAKQQVDQLKSAIAQLKEAGSFGQIQEITSLMAEFRELKQRQSFLEDLTNNVSISPQSNQFNTVILYDIENLTLGRNNPNLQTFSLTQIKRNVEENPKVNKIALQCAYTDWSDSRLQTIRNEIQQLGIETVQIFDYSHNRNAADIQLAIDAIELAHSRPSLQVFVIVSGDGAFASLAKKLHEYGKIVIGCGYDGHVSRVLRSVCDYFIPLPAPQERTLVTNFNSPTLVQSRLP